MVSDCPNVEGPETFLYIPGVPLTSLGDLCQPSQRCPQSPEQAPFHTCSHRRLALYKPSLTHLLNTGAVHSRPFMHFLVCACICHTPAASLVPSAWPGHSPWPPQTHTPLCLLLQLLPNISALISTLLGPLGEADLNKAWPVLRERSLLEKRLGQPHKILCTERDGLYK